MSGSRTGSAARALDVAGVDVDQDGASLGDTRHRDDDLDAVAAYKPDLVILPDALVGGVVRARRLAFSSTPHR